MSFFLKGQQLVLLPLEFPFFLLEVVQLRFVLALVDQVLHLAHSLFLVVSRRSQHSTVDEWKQFVTLLLRWIASRPADAGLVEAGKERA